VSEVTGDTVGRVLDSAAVLLRRNGWRQYRMGTTALGAHDVGAAVALAADADVDTTNAALNVLAAHLGMDRYALAGWNDHPDRTLDDVLAALTGAATTARGGRAWRVWADRSPDGVMLPVLTADEADDLAALADQDGMDHYLTRSGLHVDGVHVARVIAYRP
jgi:hypothetical protein